MKVLAAILLSGMLSAQTVFLSKVEKSHENTDKTFRLLSQDTQAEYLGEVEIRNFSGNESGAYREIYKRASQIGANAFRLKSQPDILGKPKFNPDHYFLDLYYIETPKKDEGHTVYIFSGSAAQTIRYNGRDVNLQPRTYLKDELKPGDEINISTKKLLGTTIKMVVSSEMPPQNFQIFGAKVRGSTDYSGGLVFKTGDIITLDSSYADFLRTIYTQVEE